MKTGRRQELRANELNQLLTDAGAFFRKNGSYVVIGLIVIGGLLGSRWYVNNRSAAALNSAYGQLLSLGLATSLTTDDECRESIERLKELASEIQQDQFTLEALSSRAAIASSRLISAASGEVQMDFVEEARQACAEIIERYSDHALEYGTALMGQAILEQTLFVADQDPAHRDRSREYLQRIVDDARLQLTPLTTLATERLNDLDEVFQPVTLAVRPPPVVLPTPTTDTPTDPEDIPPADDVSEETQVDQVNEETQADSTSEQDVDSPEPDAESPEAESADSPADDAPVDDTSPADTPPGDEDAPADSPTEPE
ncbi:MAG: hypothetical protein IID37_08765 [Planctomycetes bacterium]|nr:hypothetical protein [Planctomycetota bacterium]